MRLYTCDERPLDLVGAEAVEDANDTTRVGIFFRMGTSRPSVILQKEDALLLAADIIRLANREVTS